MAKPEKLAKEVELAPRLLSIAKDLFMGEVEQASLSRYAKDLFIGEVEQAGMLVHEVEQASLLVYRGG